MKGYFLLSLFVLSLFAAMPAYAQTQPNPTMFHCLGSCPFEQDQNRVISVTPIPTSSTHIFQQVTNSPSQTVSITNTSPSPSTSPSSVQTTTSSSSCISISSNEGLIQQFVAFLLELLVLLLQQSGIQIPGVTSCTPTITTPVTGIVSPTVAPVATTSPTATVSTPTSTPTSAPANIVQPTVIPTPTTTTTPTTVTLPITAIENWAGYVYPVEPGTTNDTVTASWTIPTVTCDTKGVVSPWTGFGGFVQNDNNIAQLGDDFDCSSGAIAYNPWTEAFPAAPIYYNHPISVGDQITASVKYPGNGDYDTSITDITKGWNVSVTMTFTSGVLAAQSGETVLEELNTGAALQDFNPVDFTNSDFSFDGDALQGFSLARGLVRLELASSLNPNARNVTAVTTTSPITGGTFSISKQ
jgi:hypothetical protein